jgi:hypothetical protein
MPGLTFFSPHDSKDLAGWCVHECSLTNWQKQSLGNIFKIHVLLYSRIVSSNPCHLVFACSWRAKRRPNTTYRLLGWLGALIRSVKRGSSLFIMCCSSSWLPTRVNSNLYLRTSDRGVLTSMVWETTVYMHGWPWSPWVHPKKIMVDLENKSLPIFISFEMHGYIKVLK